ncbi:MAG: galactose oxidase-like domain-containing protein [Gemmatimonadales bacterium]
MPLGTTSHLARRAAGLGCAAALATGACVDEHSQAGPAVGEPPPGDVEVGADAPLDLSYLCGNRFVVTSAYGAPINVTYRVAGSTEDGAVEVAAALAEDPAVSEAMIETRTRGTVQIFLDGQPVVARANEGVPCSPAPAAPALTVAASVESGQWSQPFTWPIVGVHTMLLPTGRVLAFGRSTPQVWNPANGAVSAVPAPANLFCSGHALLSDGRVLLAGGHISDNHGLPDITLFSASSNTWTSGAPMARGRWYPTTTVMGNGDVAILAGRDQAGVAVTIPEVWSNGSVRRLTNAPRSLPYYPRAFLAPDGRLFVAGPTRPTRFLSLTGAGSWSNGPTRLFGAREYGSAVMYDDGKILYAGGSRTTNTAETIDLNLSKPVWKWTGSMSFARRHLNLTVLPTGEVLATGGVGGTLFNDLSRPVRAAEIWNPASGQWTTLASSAVVRGYHATSLLLPDGRVLHAGSGDGAGAPNQRNAELFSPPYLFRGARPVITSAPTEVRYGAQFRILTSQSATITRVSLIRLGATTHAFDENQRFQRMAFSSNSTGLTVAAPSSRNRTPPGHYMVFILNGADVPSVGRIIRIW